MFRKLVTAAAVACFATVGFAGDKLSVGDAAPAVKAGKWVKGEPVKEFESGKVYVVEFWATWCPPCRDSIPHLTKLQKEYKDKGVTIIGVSSEQGGLSKVEPFVDDWGDKMNYTVVFDDDRETSKAYMEAAGKSGIPTAFVVDQQSRIAWIGHPMNGLDGVLEKVVAGTWDAASEAAMQKKAEELLGKVQQQWSNGDKAAALETIDELIAVDPNVYGGYSIQKFTILLSDPAVKDEAAAFAYADKISDSFLKDNAQALNSIAWLTLTTPGVTNRDLDLATKLAERAAKLTDHEEPAILDTLAYALHADGDLDGAIKWQRRAVDLAGDNAELAGELKERLEQYEAEAAGG